MTWNCHRCDTANNFASISCEVCDSPRVGSFAALSTSASENSRGGAKVVLVIFVFFVILAVIVKLVFVKIIDGPKYNCAELQQKYVYAINLKLRSSPGVKPDNEISILPSGTIVCRVGDIYQHVERNGNIAPWGKVKVDSQEGWVNLCHLGSRTDQNEVAGYVCKK